MKQVKFSELAKTYDKWYENLYKLADIMNNHDVSLLMYPWMRIGDDYIKNHIPEVGQFVRIRGDFLSSDREVEAFYLTLLDLDLLEDSFNIEDDSEV